MADEEQRDGIPQSARFASPIAAFALILVVAALGSNLAIGNQFPGVDFWHARVVPIAIRAGLDGNVYARDGRERIRNDVLARPAATPRERLAATRTAAGDERFLGYPGIETVASPLLFATLAPFSNGTYDGDQLAFRIAGLACFYAAAVVLCLIAGYSWTAAGIAAGAIGLTYEPLLSELRVVNVNLIQLGMLTLFLALQRRPRPALDVASGAVLAFTVLFKPNTASVLAAVAITWLCDRRWRELASLGVGGLLGAVIAVAVSAAALGSARLWIAWLAVVPDLVSSTRSLAEGNFALTGLLRQALGVDLSHWVLGALTVAIAVAAIAGIETPPPDDHTRSRFHRTYLAVGLGAAAMALSARLVWLHYFVLLLPLVLFLLRPRATGTEVKHGRVTFGIAAVAALMFTSGTKIALLDSGLTTLLAYAATLAVATAALFALALDALRRPSH